MAHILVVDDSATDLFVFKRVLELNGHQVTTAGNGREGIALARKLIPDLVFMDVVMPELNGFQATRELKSTQVTKDIPVVMVTSKEQKSDIQWARRQGAQAYIVKPAVESQLLGCINKFIAPKHHGSE